MNLIELAKRNTKGKITIDDGRKQIADYYHKKHESESPSGNAEYSGYIIESPTPAGSRYAGRSRVLGPTIEDTLEKLKEQTLTDTRPAIQPGFIDVNIGSDYDALKTFTLEVQ